MTYGPGQREWELIPSTILALLEDRPPRLSSGQRQLDWIYVDDVIEGFLRAGCVPGLEGATLDLGSGSAVSIRELIGHIRAVSGSLLEPIFGVLPDRPAEPVRIADIGDTYAKIGWRPVVSLEEGLRRTVEWLRKRREEGRVAHPGTHERATRERERRGGL
jgi:nucleoside-diphosphate-sugar epimerase